MELTPRTLSSQLTLSLSAIYVLAISIFIVPSFHPIAFAQTGEWTQIGLEGRIPDARDGHRMVYDSNRNVIILFGGRTPVSETSDIYFDDTWEWDGISWHQIQTNGERPVFRSGCGMAFDSNRNKVVMYGGFDGDVFARNNALMETWEYDESGWTKAATHLDPNPGGSIFPTMEYDSVRQITILHGGARSLAISAQTWAWDGTAWTNLTPENPRERGPNVLTSMMAYDPVRERMVLFGGANGPSDVINRHYEWNGSVWERINPVGINQPQARSGGFMEFHPILGKVILFGGGTRPEDYYLSTMLDDMWTWDGTQWE